jgi:hypothetical protein
MRKTKSTTSNKPAAQAGKHLGSPAIEPVMLASEAFLEDAQKESKRNLLMDHARTIKTLRDEKRFTFRAIADWLGERGVETDHSAVYRVYLASVPEHERDPFDSTWSDVDELGYADESVEVKKEAGK